jgi:hypothetical protein
VNNAKWVTSLKHVIRTLRYSVVHYAIFIKRYHTKTFIRKSEENTPHGKHIYIYIHEGINNNNNNNNNNINNNKIEVKDFKILKKGQD